MRRLFATVLVLIGLLTAVLVYRSAIINLLAPSFLSRAGLQEATFRLSDISTSHVSIDYATGLLPLNSGAVRVKLEQVEYDFSFTQVLAGKVERFKVGRAELSLPAWKSPSADVQKKTPQQAFSLQQFFQMLENIKALPVEALRIENLVLHTNINGQEYTPPVLLLDYTSTPEGGTLLVQEQPVQGQETALALELVLEGKKVEANLVADMTSLQGWLPQTLQMSLPFDRGRLEAQALISQEQQELRTARLSAQGKDIGNAQWQAATLTLNLTVASPHGSEDLILARDSRLVLQGLKSQSLQLDAALLPLRGAVHFLPNGVQAEWQPQEALQLSGLLMGETRIAALAVHNVLAQVDMAAGKQQTEVTRERARIALDSGARLEMQQLSAPGLQVGTLQASLPLEAQFFHNRQELRWRSVALFFFTGLKAGNTVIAPLTARNIDLHFEQSPEASHLEADFLVPEASGAFHLNWQHKAASATNQLRVQTKKPLQLGTDASPLRLLAKPPAALSAVAVEQGELAAELNLSWGKGPMNARLDLDLQNAVASHANIRYSGIALQHDLQLMPQLRSVQAGKLTIAAIEGPVRVDDLLARVQLLPSGKKEGLPTLLIEDGNLRIFDGRVQTSACRYDPNRGSNTCTFTLHNLDLAAILALHQVEGLDVSGRINGNIPVRHDRSGFSVADGSLANAGAGGVIHYQPSSEALKSSPYSEYVLQALEDYRYHNLVASISYKPDGTLLAGLQLQGKSPKLETSRPVHLNLQAEQNLLSLLKSLQYSQGLTSELNRRVQERFQPKQAK